EWLCTAGSVGPAAGPPWHAPFPLRLRERATVARRSVGAAFPHIAIEPAPGTISIWPAPPVVLPRPRKRGPLRRRRPWLSGCSRLACTAAEGFRLAPQAACTE